MQATMYPYEGMFLVDPNLYAEDSEAVENTVKGLLEKHGAKIVQFERWDERKLAYEIKGHKRGVFLLAHFEMPGTSLDAMRRETRIIESILRNLVVRLEDDIPTFLEKSAKYAEIMKEDHEARRARREEAAGDGGGYGGGGGGGGYGASRDAPSAVGETTGS